MRAAIRWIAIVGAALLTGCNLAPRYDPPHYALPQSFQGAEAFQPAHPEVAGTPRGSWWTVFGDEQLNRLEGQLERSNPTLQAAAETYTQARDLAAEAQSSLYPDVESGASTSNNRQSAHRLFRAGDSGRNDESTNLLSVAASWEPDFWHALHNRAHQQKRLAQASAADLADARLSLEAELATDYVALRGLDAQILVLDQLIVAYGKEVEVAQLRVSGKISSGLDLAQASSELSSAQAQETETRLQRDLMQHAIAVLIGGWPSDFTLAPASSFSLLVPPIPALIPSALLQRRPDIVSAERTMAAANVAIGVSRAAFYPNISFSAAGGFQANSLNLLSVPNSLWSIGAGAVLPLFEGGLRRAELQRTWSAYAQTRDYYRATVLSAFQEVEDGLSLTHRLEIEVNQQQQASVQAAQALNIAMTLYNGGLSNYLSVSLTQVQALTAETVEVRDRTRQVQAAIQLIRALGGGWSVEQLPTEQQILPLGPFTVASHAAPAAAPGPEQ